METRSKHRYNSLSASALDAYDSCPRYYECRYIKRLPTKQGGAMIAGSAYHRGVAYALGTIINGLSFTMEEVKTIVSEAWDGMVKSNSMKVDEEGNLIEVKHIDWGDKDPNTYKKTVLQLTELYIATMLSNIDAVAVEKKHTREIAPGLVVIGYTDIELRDDNIIENKFSTRRKSQGEVDNENQPGVYAYLLDRPLTCTYHQALDQKKLDFNIVKTKRSRDDIDWIKNKMLLTWKLIQTGVFPPQTNSWRCSMKYCEYYVDCRILHMF